MIKEQHAHGGGKATEVHYEEKSFQPQTGIDCPKRQVCRDADEGDGDEERQDMGPFETKLCAERHDVKGKSGGIETKKREGQVEGPERIITDRLVSCEVAVYLHVRIVMSLTWPLVSVHEQTIVFGSIPEKQPSQGSHPGDRDDAHNHPSPVIIVSSDEPIESTRCDGVSE